MPRGLARFNRYTKPQRNARARQEKEPKHDAGKEKQAQTFPLAVPPETPIRNGCLTALPFSPWS